MRFETRRKATNEREVRLYYMINFLFSTQYSIFLYTLNLKNKSINNINQDTKIISELDSVMSLIKSFCLCNIDILCEDKNCKTKLI